MKVVITSSREVGRVIAIVIGATKKRQGYYFGNGYLVTWTTWDLITLPEIEDYIENTVAQNELPFIPEQPNYVLRQQRTKQGKLRTCGMATAQMEFLEELLNENGTQLIMATEPSKNGELLAWYVYDRLKCKLPVYRVWISSLTHENIRHAFANLGDATYSRELHFQAKTRHYCDWLIAVNATAAIRRKVPDYNFNLGRLTSGLLTLMMDSYNRKLRFNWAGRAQMKVTLDKDGVEFYVVSNTIWRGELPGLSTMKKVKNAKFVRVLEVRSKEHTQAPPMLFNMRTLQIEAGKRIGYNAWRTNFLTMSLYQKRYLTYPRVSGNQIRESTYKQLPMLLDVHRKHRKYKEHIRWIQSAPITKRLVGDLKEMEHEGIFITPRYQYFLTMGQKKLVDLIMERIVQSLSDDCQRQLTSVKVEAAGQVFTGHLSKIIEPGWRAVTGELEYSNKDTVLQEIPDLAVGDRLIIKSVEMLHKNYEHYGIFHGSQVVKLLDYIYKKEGDLWADHDLAVGHEILNKSVIHTLYTHDLFKYSNGYYYFRAIVFHLTRILKHTVLGQRSTLREFESTLMKYFNKELSQEQWQEYFHAHLKRIVTDIESLELSNMMRPFNCPKCGHTSVYVKELEISCINPYCKWEQSAFIMGVSLNLEQIEQILEPVGTRVSITAIVGEGLFAEKNIYIDKECNIAWEDPKMLNT